MHLQAKGVKHAADAARDTLRAQVLDPKTGMPVLQERISATDLLRDIRLQKVDRIEYIDNAQYTDNWYRDATTWNQIDGACLVVYKDGRVIYVSTPGVLLHAAHALLEACQHVPSNSHSVSAMLLSQPSLQLALQMRLSLQTSLDTAACST